MNGAVGMQMRVHKQLTRTFWRVHRSIRSLLEPWGVTPRQYTLLLHVSEEGVALTDLASHMNADLSTANGIVNRLEKGGYVERERCTCDRRVVLVKLTRKGRELREKVVPELDTQIGNWYAELTEDELNQLYELLARLHNTVGSCRKKDGEPSSRE